MLEKSHIQTSDKIIIDLDALKNGKGCEIRYFKYFCTHMIYND